MSVQCEALPRKIQVHNAGRLSGGFRTLQLALPDGYETTEFGDKLNFGINTDPGLNDELTAAGIDPQKAFLFGSFQIRDAFDRCLLSSWAKNLFLVPATDTVLRTKLEHIGRYYYRAVIVDGDQDGQLYKIMENRNNYRWLTRMFGVTAGHALNSRATREQGLHVFDTGTILRLQVKES